MEPTQTTRDIWLRRRSLFRSEYEARTSREHLGMRRPAHVPHQLGASDLATAAAE